MSELNPDFMKYSNINGKLVASNNDKICFTDVVFLSYMAEGIIYSDMLTADFEC